MLEIINNRVFVRFCRFPHSQIHIRALARQLRVSPPTVLELAKPLLRRGLLQRTRMGRSIVLSAVFEEDFIYHKKWANLFLLLDSGLIRKISGLLPKTIILFGSYARGEDHERSDIDLAVDGEVPFSLAAYERILHRPIQVHRLGKDVPPLLLENIREGILLEGVMA